MFNNTSEEPTRSCVIANIGIEGITPANLSKTLLEKYKIWTVVIDSSNFHGVRITPNGYTTTQELDTFVSAMVSISKE